MAKSSLLCRLVLRSLGEGGPHRLTVRTPAFQAVNPGSIPGGVIARLPHFVYHVSL